MSTAEAKLPKFCGRTLVMRAAEEPVTVNPAAPAYGRKAVLYATCFSNYNNPEIGMAARRVLAHNGVATEVGLSALLRHAAARARRRRAASPSMRRP